jgi:diguanylate cyclase (GGDEF)-like protein/PAS domain S-box-containing protein
LAFDSIEGLEKPLLIMNLMKIGSTISPFPRRMFHGKLTRLLLLIILLSLLLVACGDNILFIPNSGLTTLKVVLDNNYPPFTFLDDNGNLQGILIDRWKLWEKKTGIEVEITGLDWNEALARMQAGEFDVIDTIFLTESRAQIYDFSSPYQEIEVPIYFNNKISGIVDARSLKGFSVAVKSNDAAIDFLRTRGVTNLVEFDSYESIVQSAAKGDVVVFVIDQPPADYFLFLYGVADQFNSTDPLYAGEFHRAVLKGNALTLGIVENGFAQITEAEYKSIDRKWYGTPSIDNTIFSYLGLIGIIILCVLLILLIWNYSLQAQVKRKTRVLAESEQKFRQIFETSALGITTADQSGQFLSCNPAFQKMLGYTIEEFNQLTLKSITHPDDYFKNIELFNKIWKGELNAYSIEKRNLHKDGHYLWGNLTASMVRDPDGKPVFSIGMFEDITERKQSEKVRESIYKISQASISSATLDDLFASIHQTLEELMPVENFYIALYEPTTNLLHFPFFKDLFEISAPPIEPGHGLSDYVMRKGKPLLATCDVFDRLIASGEVELIGAKPVDWLGVPLIVTDQVIGVMATQSYSEDIHFSQKDAQLLEFVSTQIAQAIEIKRAEKALHLSESRYRYLFEDSPVSIWEEDFSEVKVFLEQLKDEGVRDFNLHFMAHSEDLIKCISLVKVLDVNHEALRLTHAKDKAELFAQMNTVLDANHASEFIEEFANIAEGKLKFEWEGVNKTLDGQSINVSMRWVVADGFEESLSKVIVSLFDITERKLAEAELLESEERYRSLVDNLGEGVVVIDEQGKFTFANPSANEIFGVLPLSLTEYQLFDFVEPDKKEFVQQQIQKRTLGESNTHEMEIIRKDGEHRYVQITARPQFDQHHRFFGTHGIVHDITDRRIAEDKLKARSRFEELLANISTRFINVESEDIDGEINRVLKQIGTFVNVDRTYVFKIDNKRKVMRNTNEWCQEGIQPKIDELQNLAMSDLEWFVEQITCDRLILGSLKDMPATAKVEKEMFSKHGIQSLANFPMWVNLELIGFVGFETVKAERDWDLEDLSMLQQFTNIISNAIERSRLLRILEDRAVRDELTGVLNRRGFLELASGEINRAHRYNHPVGMILLDMDHLKRLNDTYGHAAGDLALQEIARYCQVNIRGNDILARWGGDEFVILLPESDYESTLMVAERLHQTIAAQPLRIDSQSVQLSISAGLAMDSGTVLTIDELFRDADSALYVAKQAGRNQVKTYEPSH